MPRSDLDKELEQAVKAASGAEPFTVTAAGPAAKKKGNIALLAGLLVMAAGVLFLVMTGFKSATVYAKRVDEVVAERAALTGRTLRVEGLLVHGTIERRDKPCEYKFRIEHGGQTLMVRYPQCVVPDTFRDETGVDIGVTVEGKLAPGGELVATLIMPKCPSKYEQRARDEARDAATPM
jgi:cytochrome c-type biogenesis protein CcmE